MSQTWTFTKKIGAGLLVALAAMAGLCAIAHWSNQVLLEANGRVETTHAVIDALGDLISGIQVSEDQAHVYVLTGTSAMGEKAHATLANLPKLTASAEAALQDGESLAGLDELKRQLRIESDQLEKLMAARKEGGFEAASKLVEDDNVEVVRIQEIEDGMESALRIKLARETDAAHAKANLAKWTLFGGTLVALILLAGGGFMLARSLTRQIGSAVSDMQSASTELQAAANQQASGSKEQATAATEITTTIKELMTSSRQIAESAQRVARIADETANAARSGKATVDQAHEAIGGIRRQVDVIVEHMVDLGRRSQQIGSILEIIGELAEQTNILAINATIESAGAGDAGKRFAVVADEIRKLADRVGGSAKEIRPLIEQIRAVANAAVMATENGSKAVDSGQRRFGEVAASFSRIAESVGTTSEAAREIELSTKQQSSAVEQVNLAIGSVAIAAREMETSTSQTFQASSQLAGLSKDLAKLVTSSA